MKGNQLKGCQIIVQWLSNLIQMVIIQYPKSGRSVHFDAKVQRIDSLASELKEKHGDKFTIIQYKLWAEALDVNKHESKDVRTTCWSYLEQ